MSELFKRGVITFDKSSVRDILSWFGKSVDRDGYIIDADEPFTRVKSLYGEDIHIDDFVGIMKRRNSDIFLTSDVVSLLKIVDDLKSDN